jgi:hypothetical protein
MHPKLKAELAKQSRAFGVTVEDIMSKRGKRAAAAARRAVWAALLTRHPRGEFPATELGRVFDQHPRNIALGVRVHESGLSWAELREPKRGDNESECDFLIRQVRWLRITYTPEDVKEDCDKMNARIVELGGKPQ